MNRTTGNKIIGVRRLPVCAASCAAALLAAAAPAAAEDAERTRSKARDARIVFSYSRARPGPLPQTVTWSWTLQNIGDQTAYSTTLTHEVRPWRDVVDADAPCVVNAPQNITCNYGAVMAGSSRRGSVTVRLLSSSDQVQIVGQASWLTSPGSAAKAQSGLGSTQAKPGPR